MNNRAALHFSRRAVFLAAFRYSIPVLLGYLAIGVAFGLLMAGAGYPWWLALVMSLWMYAGAGQFIAAGLFAAGTSLWEACLIQLVVNARHMAYGLSMLKRFGNLGIFKPYMVFSLTDETFALLSSLPDACLPEARLHQGVPGAGESGAENSGTGNPGIAGEDQSAEKRRLLMFYISILDQSYWVCGSIIGAVAGHLIPYDMKGIGFALTALFVVLMIEQIQRIKKPAIFVLSGIAALAGVFFLPGRVSLLAAMALALALSPLTERKGT